MRLLRDWVNAMPNLVTCLCVVGIITVVMGAISLFTPTSTLAISAAIFGQVGTLIALAVGAHLDIKRIKRQ